MKTPIQGTLITVCSISVLLTTSTIGCSPGDADVSTRLEANKAGSGHITRVVGTGRAYLAAVPFPD